MKTFSFSQWVKFELTLYKNQQFATKQDQHFVLTKIPVFSSTFALWENAELYIMGPSLTYSLFWLGLCPFGKCRALHLGSFTYLLPFFLSSFLPFSRRKLKKSVNVDARTLQFCMSHPWTQSLRFRENQIVC